jgi:hypothetical protein
MNSGSPTKLHLNAKAQLRAQNRWPFLLELLSNFSGELRSA